MQKTFVLQFVLASHTIWLDYFDSLLTRSLQQSTMIVQHLGFITNKDILWDVFNTYTHSEYGVGILG